MASIIWTHFNRTLNGSSGFNVKENQTLHFGYPRHPIGAFVIAITGLAVWLLGYRLIKVIVVAAAFIFSCWSLFSFSPHFIHLDVCCGPGTQVEVRIAVSIIVGLMAGAIACYVYKLGVFCLGSSLGLIISIVVTSLIKRLNSPLEYYGIYGGSAIVVGLLAVAFEKAFVIISTSVIGSLGVFYAIDFVARTPFTPTMLYALRLLEGGVYEAVNDPEDFHIQINTGQLSDEALAMYGGWLLLSIGGVLVQYLYTSQDIKPKLMVKSCAIDNRADLCDDEIVDGPSQQYILLQTSPISTRLQNYGKAQRIRSYLR